MSKAESRVLQGAREALAFAKGEADPAEYGIHIPPQVDVRAIRQKTGLSQKAFAARTDFPSVAFAIGNRPVQYRCSVSYPSHHHREGTGNS